jgi:hypothetical protein
MNSIGAWLIAHQTVAVLIMAWLGSNIVSSMPSPDQSSGKGYKFFFSLMHGLAGSLPRIIPNLRLATDPSKDSTPFYAPTDKPTDEEKK